jgi:hypothetical protein
MLLIVGSPRAREVVFTVSVHVPMMVASSRERRDITTRLPPIAAFAPYLRGGAVIPPGGD